MSSFMRQTGCTITTQQPADTPPLANGPAQRDSRQPSLRTRSSGVSEPKAF